MSSAFSSPPEQGQFVTVRQPQWMVSEVAKNALLSKPLELLNGHAQHLVTLSSVAACS
jgi:hypothetical protein